MCASQTNRLPSQRRGAQNLQVQSRKSSGIGDVYTRHNSAESSWQMEMPVRDQQGCGQSILSLGLSIWRDQLDHVVAPVKTSDGFVGMSLLKGTLKNKDLTREENVALERSHRLQCAVGTNNHLFDINYQILQITELIYSCNRQKIVISQELSPNRIWMTQVTRIFGVVL